jgi:hypothetical protein
MKKLILTQLKASGLTRDLFNLEKSGKNEWQLLVYSFNLLGNVAVSCRRAGYQFKQINPVWSHPRKFVIKPA